MKKRFEDWMIRKEGKSMNTAYQYANSIDKISKHYSASVNEPVNIFIIRDKEKLKLLCEEYSQAGRFSSFGNQGNGTIRNSIAT